MTAPTPKLGAAMTDSQWILDVMGRYDFTMPQAAFDEIVRKLLARQPAAIDKQGARDAFDAWNDSQTALEFEDAEAENHARLIFTAGYSAAPLDNEASKHAETHDRLLVALERAATAESALRALVDECENDSVAGWEDRMQQRINHANRLLAAAAPAAPSVAQDSENTDDIAVESFARAMKEKMAQSRAKGRSGWEGCEPAALSRMLREHVEKGDPRDVANFCMMLWHHSAPIAPSARTANVAQGAEEPDCWAILTPNGSRLVSPDEAKGRLDAYPLYRAPPAQPALADDARDAFIRDVAAQKPEKPDHWSSCGQCGHNIERAQDLLDAAQSASASEEK